MINNDTIARTKKELHMRKIEQYIRETCDASETGMCILTREKMHELTGNSSPVYHMMFRYGICALNRDIVMELRKEGSNVVSSLKMPYTFRVLNSNEISHYNLTDVNFRKLDTLSLSYIHNTFSRSIVLKPRLMFFLLYMTDLFLIKNPENKWAFVDSNMFKNYLCMDDVQYNATLNALETAKIWIKHNRIDNLYRVILDSNRRKIIIDSSNRDIDPKDVVYVGQSNNKTRAALTESLQQEVQDTIEADSNMSSGDILKKFTEVLRKEIQDEYSKEVAIKEERIQELEKQQARDSVVFTKLSDELTAANEKVKVLTMNSYNNRVIETYRNKLEESLNNVLDKSIRKMTSTLGTANSNNIDSVVNDATSILMDLRMSLKNVIKTVKPETKEEKE